MLCLRLLICWVLSLRVIGCRLGLVLFVCSVLLWGGLIVFEGVVEQAIKGIKESNFIDIRFKGEE